MERGSETWVIAQVLPPFLSLDSPEGLSRMSTCRFCWVGGGVGISKAYFFDVYCLDKSNLGRGEAKRAEVSQKVQLTA